MPRGSSTPSTDAALALGCAALALGAYVATLTPSLGYLAGDSADLTMAAARLGVAHPTGYPLVVVLGWLAMHVLPAGEPAHRANLLAALCGAGAVGVVVRLARRLGAGRAPAAVAALALGTSPTLWSQAVVFEVYAINAFFVAVTILLLLRWSDVVDVPARADARFVGFAGWYGVALGVHLSGLGLAPAYALFVLATDPTILRRPRTIVTALAVFLLALGQYAWLPLRAHVADLFPNGVPTTVAGFWDYTLGAFANLRFALPRVDIPGRVQLVAGLLRDAFGTIGIVAGLAGMAVLWWRALPCFWLLFGMWLVHVVFFCGFAAPDVAVFFLPSLLVFALFVAVGLDAAGTRLAAAALGRAAAAALVGVPLLAGLPARFAAQDRATDTALPDFWENAYALLPRDAVLVTSRGAFGADAQYWHEVRGLRPDVVLPGGGGAPLAAPRYKARRGTPLRIDPALLPPSAWDVPVLLGERWDLVLSRVQPDAPALVVADAAPAVHDERALGPVALAGHDAVSATARPAARVQLRTWWRGVAADPPIVTTRIGGTTVEAHVLGFGNLPRWRAEHGGAPDGLVMEDVAVVIPATLPDGEHAVDVGVVLPRDGTFDVAWATLGTVVIR